MKKILWIAVSVVLAGAIGLAISGAGSNARSDSPPADRDEPAQIVKPLGQDQCLCDFYILSALPHSPGTCEVVFGVKHLENSDACCNHDPDNVRISVNNSPYQPMTPGLTEERDPCDKLNFTSGLYLLRRGVEVSWSILCDGHGTCALSGNYTPYCD